MNLYSVKFNDFGFIYVAAHSFETAIAKLLLNWEKKGFDDITIKSVRLVATEVII